MVNIFLNFAPFIVSPGPYLTSEGLVKLVITILYTHYIDTCMHRHAHYPPPPTHTGAHTTPFPYSTHRYTRNTLQSLFHVMQMRPYVLRCWADSLFEMCPFYPQSVHLCPMVLRNNASCLVLRVPQTDHISPHLASLHRFKNTVQTRFSVLQLPQQSPLQS